MGGWDEYCTICGGPPFLPSFDQGEPLPPPLPNPADYTWLESFIGISSKEELIPLTSYDDYGKFGVQSDKSPYASFYIGSRNEDYIDEKLADGYACHVTCYNLLQQELNYTLKHADMVPLLDDNPYVYNRNIFWWSDYGGLGEYQETNFGHAEVQLVRDGKLWMIEDPSRDAQNKERILQLWRPLVESGFKRPEPSVGYERKACPKCGRFH